MSDFMKSASDLDIKYEINPVEIKASDISINHIDVDNPTAHRNVPYNNIKEEVICDMKSVIKTESDTILDTYMDSQEVKIKIEPFTVNFEEKSDELPPSSDQNLQSVFLGLHDIKPKLEDITEDQECDIDVERLDIDVHSAHDPFSVIVHKKRNDLLSSPDQDVQCCITGPHDIKSKLKDATENEESDVDVEGLDFEVHSANSLVSANSKNNKVRLNKRNRTSNNADLESGLVRSRNGKICKPKSELSCPYCNLKMYTKPGLLWHLKVKHSQNKKRYECFHCGQKMISKIWLARHINVQHNKHFRMNKCPMCPYENKWKTNVFRHIKMKHDETTKVLTCQYCTYTSKWPGNLRRHCIEKHMDITEVALKYDDGRNNNNLQQGKYTCIHCNFEGKNQTDLTRHMKTAHNITDKSFSCSICSFVTKHENSLRSHINSKHNKGRELFKCTECDFGAASNKTLKAHIRLRHRSKKCPECGLVTSSRLSLSRHVRNVHTENIYFQCAICNYKLKHKATLIKHIQSKHTSNIVVEFKEFKCSDCNAKFDTQLGLSVHRRFKHVRN